MKLLFLFLAVNLVHFFPPQELRSLLGSQISKAVLGPLDRVPTDLKYVFLVDDYSLAMAGSRVIIFGEGGDTTGIGALIRLGVAYLLLEAFNKGYKIAYF